MKRDRQQQEILGEAVRNAFLKLDPRTNGRILLCS